MSMERRVAALEAAVVALEAKVGGDDRSAAPSSAPEDAAEGEQFWILQGQEERHPDGVVHLSGHVPIADGRVRWQIGLSAQDLSARPWEEGADVLAALGHPVRLRLLQLVHDGVTTTADLAAQESVGSTGQVHHHLRILIQSGWLVHRARGEYAIPPARVVPLLACLTAALA